MLKSKGINSLDKVIITHSDADHMEGLDDLQKNITINELIYAKGAENKPIMKEALAAMPKVKQTIIFTVLSGKLAKTVSNAYIQIKQEKEEMMTLLY